MNRTIEANKKRISRKRRTRSKIFGTSIRPRVSVFRSNKFMSVQLIDDEKGHTLAAVSTKSFAKKSVKKTDQATEAGKQIAELAKKMGIKSAVFDKSSYRYHGRVRAIAEALREGGIVM